MPVHPPETFAKGRRCRSCDCFLSVYNARDRCAQCRPEDKTLANLVKQSEREEFTEAIAQLLEQT